MHYDVRFEGSRTVVWMVGRGDVQLARGEKKASTPMRD
jgi:hypothetical protein